MIDKRPVSPVVLNHLACAQDVEIVVQPIPRFVSNWLIGIGRILAALIKLKVTVSITVTPFTGCQEFLPTCVIPHAPVVI